MAIVYPPAHEEWESLESSDPEACGLNLWLPDLDPESKALSAWEDED